MSGSHDSGTRSWDGHQPQLVARQLDAALTKKDFKVDHVDSLDALLPPNDLTKYSVIIPNWTMGTMPHEIFVKLSEAIKGGVSFAGIHGGMGDAFRGNTDYEWMVGGPSRRTGWPFRLSCEKLLYALYALKI